MLAGLLKIFWEEMWIYVIHFSIAITEVLRQCSHYVHIELIRLREGYLYQFTKSGLLWLCILCMLVTFFLYYVYDLHNK